MKIRTLKTSLILLLLWALASPAHSQVLLNPSDTLNNKRLNGFILGATAAYGVALVGLNELWYSDFEKQSFQFFNDNGDWKQVDKVGHFYSSYHLSMISMNAYQWAGVKEKNAYLWGSVTGMIVMLPIEIMDGFSSGYGASWGDLVANATGSFALYGQYALWKEIRIHPKFSFHQTSLAEQRPETLGENYVENLLKDYNGQTYWLSFDLYKFMKEDSRFPKWLNVALGYGANNMLYANDAQNTEMGFDAYRQFYLGIDFDLTHIQTQSGFVQALLYFVNMIRLPAPTLEWNQKDGIRFHVLYF